MRTMKWLAWFGIGLVAVCVAFATVGCGDDGDDDGTTVVVTNQTTVVTNAAPQALVAPQLVTPADGTVYSTLLVVGTLYAVGFEWTPVPGATSYVLEIDGEQIPVAGTTASLQLDYGDYRWRVWARDANGAGPASGKFDFTVQSSLFFPMP